MRWKAKLVALLSDELVKDTIWTTVLSTAGKGAGFLIPFFIATWFGVSSETDAFFFAYGLIIFLATIFSPVVESIIVPFIVDARIRNEDIGSFVGRLLGISAIGLCALSFIFLTVIKIILPHVTRFSPDGLTLIYTILLESIPLVILLIWTSILAGTLNAYKNFSIPALSPAIRAVMTLSFIFLFKSQISIHAIALGYVIGEIIRLGLLLYVLYRLKIVRLKLSFRWDQLFNKFIKTSFYQIVSMSLMAFTPIVNKTMASWLGQGNVTLLEYADRLYMIPITMFGSGLAVTLLSHWSERYQVGGVDRLKVDVIKVVKTVGLLGILITFFLLLIKYDLVRLAYDHGKVPGEEINKITTILGYYLFGITPYFLSQVYVRAFLTIMNTKIILFVTCFIFFGTIMLNYFLIEIMGVSGIALATTILWLSAFIILDLIFFMRLKRFFR